MGGSASQSSGSVSTETKKENQKTVCWEVADGIL